MVTVFIRFIIEKVRTFFLFLKNFSISGPCDCEYVTLPANVDVRKKLRVLENVEPVRSKRSLDYWLSHQERIPKEWKEFPVVEEHELLIYSEKDGGIYRRYIVFSKETETWEEGFSFHGRSEKSFLKLSSN